VVFQERHWTSPEMAATLQAAIINTPQSDRLKQALHMTPRLLSVYFATALRDVSDCMLFVYLNNVSLYPSITLLLLEKHSYGFNTNDI